MTLPVTVPSPLPADAPDLGAVSRHPPRRLDPSYAPGPLRAATDAVADTVASFCHRHPEYAKLGSDAIVQAMSTYRTEEEEAARGVLADEGVPVDVLCGFRPADPITPDDSEETV